MKKLVILMILILFCSCGQPHREPYNKSSIAKSSQTTDVREAQIPAKTLATKDNYILQVTGNRDAEGILFRLTNESLNYDKTLAVSECDEIVGLYFFDDEFFSNYNNAIEILLDVQNHSATVIVLKNHYELNFDLGTYTFDIQYRIQDLDRDRPHDTSPDGRYEIYTTNIRAEADLAWGDFVILDTKDNSIWFLTSYEIMEQAIFCGENRVLINRINRLELLDMNTGEPIPNAPDFAYGQSKTREGHPQFYTLGMVYGSVQKKTLIAYRRSDARDTDWERTACVYIAVYDENGERNWMMDTGFMIQPYVGSFQNMISIKLIQNDMVKLTAMEQNGETLEIEPFDLGTIHYEMK